MILKWSFFLELCTQYLCLCKGYDMLDFSCHINTAKAHRWQICEKQGCREGVRGILPRGSVLWQGPGQTIFLIFLVIYRKIVGFRYKWLKKILIRKFYRITTIFCGNKKIRKFGRINRNFYPRARVWLDNPGARLDSLRPCWEDPYSRRTGSLIEEEALSAIAVTRQMHSSAYENCLLILSFIHINRQVFGHI